MKKSVLLLIVMYLSFMTNITLTAQRVTNSPFVGKIEAASDVSPTGAALYTIPIKVPDGVAGIQPNLSIVYNSQLEEGILGMGGNLVGASYISRIIPSAANGFLEKIKLNNEGYFALDGNPLIRTGSNTYTMENKDFSSITLSASGDQFVVTRPDGSVAIYSGRVGPAQSTTYFAYALTQYTDRNGNYIKYYYKPGADGALDKIEYTGNGSKPCPYEVRFEYIANPRKKMAYLGGVSAYKNEYLLNKINIYSSSKKIFSYEVGYTYDDCSIARLDYLKYLNSVGESLNTTNFTPHTSSYYESTLKITINDDIYTEDQGGDYTLFNRQWGSISNVETGIKYLVSFFDYHYPQAQYVSKLCSFAPTKDALGNITYNYVSSKDLPPSLSFKDILSLSSLGGSMDFNGDGDAELVVPVLETDDTFGGIVSFNLVSVNKGGGLDVHTYRISVPSSQKEIPPFTVEDLNHDGISDIVMHDNAGTMYLFYGVLNPKWLQDIKPITMKMTTGYTNVRKVFCSDLIGDGLVDIALATSDVNLGTVFYENQGGDVVENNVVKCSFTKRTESDAKLNFGSEYANSFLISGDFNGDGLTDFVYNRRPADWFVAYNKGNYTFDHVQIPRTVLSAEEETDTQKNDEIDDIFAIDWNGDGLCDLISSDAIYSQSRWEGYDFRWIKSTGANFTLAKKRTWNDYDYPFRRFILIDDFNEDGIFEFSMLGSNMFGYGSSDFGLYSYTLESKPMLKNKMETIVDGFRKTTSFFYKPGFMLRAPGYSDKKVYSYPMNNMSPGICCVEKMTQMRPDKQLFVNTTYHYSKLLYNVQRKQSVGFEEIISNDLIFNTKSVVNNYYTADGYPDHVVNYTYVNDNLSATNTNYYDCQVNSLAYAGKTFKQYLTTMRNTSLQNHLTGVTTQTEYTYDGNHQNLLSEKTSYIKDGFNGYKKVEYQNYNSLNLPGKIVSTLKHPDDNSEFVTFSEFMYDAKGNRTQAIENAHDANKKVTTTFSNFTDWGTPQNKEIITGSGAHQISIPTSYVYDSSGKYVLSETTSDGTTSYVYDVGLEVLKQKTNVYGKTAYYMYDNWGNLIEQTDVFGKKTSFVMAWCDDNIRMYKAASSFARSLANGQFYEITVTRVGETPKWTAYDVFGNELVSEQIICGETYANVQNFNNKNQLTSATLYCRAYFLTGDSYTYDEYGRVQTYQYKDKSTETYSYSGLTTTQTDGRSTKVTVSDPMGNVKQVQENGKNISYTYKSNGKPASITSPDSNVQYVYDSCGNETYFSDGCLDGNIARTFDGLGNLLSETNAMGNTSQFTYYGNGRVKEKTTSDRTITYTYTDKGDIQTVALAETDNNVSFTYTYDPFGRLLSKSNQPMIGTFQFGYDSNNRISDITYPDGKKVEAIYDATDGISLVGQKYNNNILWQQTEKNYQQIVFSYGNNKTETYFYETYSSNKHALKSITVPGISEQQYTFNPLTTLLESRTLNTIEDRFTYDVFDRLLTEKSYKNNILLRSGDLSYIGGRIQSKSNAGTYSYDGSFPLRISQVASANSSLMDEPDEIRYNSIEKVSYLKKGNTYAEFFYGPDNGRNMMKVYKDNVLYKTVYYDGSYEKVVYASGDVYQNIYLNNTIGSDVLLQTKNGTNNIYYLHKDYLGSIVAITDAAGQLKEMRSYDAWGKRRNPNATSSSDYYNVSAFDENTITSRGYIGEEHLDEFGLMNLNARIYSPTLGVFLSPDPYMSLSSISGFNRYAYCFNNPLKYTDPTGEWFGIDDLLIAGAGFLFGYIGHGISTGDWGGKALAAGGIGAGMAWLGYNVPGLATGSITNSTWNQVGSMGINTMANQVMPSINVPLGSGFGLSMSPAFGLGAGGLTAGLNWGIMYVNGNFAIGGSTGIGQNYWGWNAAATYKGYGIGYGQTSYDASMVMGHQFSAQRVGSLTGFFNYNSFSISNDLWGDGGDRWRTSAAELTIGNWAVGTYLYTNNGYVASNNGWKDKSDNCIPPFPVGLKISGKKETWRNGRPYFAPFWVGYRNQNQITRVGFSHEIIHNLTQNMVHKFMSTPYYMSYDEFRRGGYFYTGYRNSLSLWER